MDLQGTSNIVSLSEKRREKNKKTAQAIKPEAVRILELEAEVGKLVDITLELQSTVSSQGKRIDRLLSLLRKYVPGS